VSCGLRDVANLEAAGLPTLLVHTHAFAAGAEAQAEMLGQPSMRRVHVPHPVQDKTTDDIRALAASNVDEILSRLTDEGATH
jgi:hypothetical protein